MESQPQNPEFRINPEHFHPCFMPKVQIKQLFESKIVFFLICQLTFFYLILNISVNNFSVMFELIFLG